MAVDLTNITFFGKASFAQANGNVVFPSVLSKSLTVQQVYGKGVGAAQVNRLSVQQFTIAASGTLAIDLTAGTYSGAGSGNVVDLNGTAITFARVKGLLIELEDLANGSTGIHLNPAATNALSATLGGPVKAAGTAAGQEGGLLWWDPSAAGIAVDGTHKILSIVNDDSSHAATVNVLVAGGAT